MINAREKLHEYTKQGLETKQGFSKPGQPHAWPSLGEIALYTISGGVELYLLDEAQEVITLEPGVEYIIKANQRHIALAGEKGWKHIVAWSLSEKTPDH